MASTADHVRKPQSRRGRKNLLELIVMAVTIAMIVVFSVTIDGFASLGNLKVVLSNSTSLVMLSCGMAVVIISRGLDLSIIAGMVAGVPLIRTPELFFVVVIAWGVVTGFAEASIGWFARRTARESGTAQERSEARDAITVGALGLVLGVALAFVPAQYALRYHIDEAHQTFVLTGITIGVGILGAYAAIVAVYLGIAGFSPRRIEPERHPDAATAGEESGRVA